MRRRKFKDHIIQRQYETALKSHDKLMKGGSLFANAYVIGFKYGPKVRRWNRGWSTYAFWAAGVDNRRAQEELNEKPTKDPE